MFFLSLSKDGATASGFFRSRFEWLDAARTGEPRSESRARAKEKDPQAMDAEFSPPTLIKTTEHGFQTHR